MSMTNQIREAFFSYFKSKGHSEVSSSSLVPHNDPTLMFTNAGMNQFKNVFTGLESPPEPPRATTAQKCVRAGGKHNDLDNVGYTKRHHTFFEMMGNFSFGDYFKEDAIAHAWELLTKEFGLSPDKLGITVYHTDDEAFDIWKKVSGFSDSKILRIPTKDNFWEMGATGPCGPCSEIFYDHGEGNGEWALDANGNDKFDERFVEIWNLVFMQYEKKEDGTQIDLPKPSIDTGMGLERMAAVLQNVSSNYEIDLFRKLISASQELTKTKAEGDQKASHQVIADHLRSSCFLMADGVLPSNEGRGYVLRRIMRRAMRHAHLLGCKEPLMHKLVPTLIAEMGDQYGELKRAEAMISENLELEEYRFKKTLERGLKLLDEERASLKNNQLDGHIAFKLYDTYGFPLDLTEDILRGHNESVDKAGFDAAMAEQKTRARAAWSGSGESAVGALWFDIKEEVGATDFLGFAQDSAQAKVVAIVKDDVKVETLKSGESGYVITNQSPFYGESGGQAGDKGTISGIDLAATVTDTQKPLQDFHVHHVSVQKGELKLHGEITLSIDVARRAAIRANHSATHLLHAVLRNVLGEHITQKGSLVEADRLRFDISQPKAISAEEMIQIESEVNRLIWANTEVNTKLMPPEEAIEEGAMALFGEKYGDEVRVLSMGFESAKAYSVELCGGTHVKRTGDIGLFKIVNESAISAGVRRIEAITASSAMAYLSDQEHTVKSLASLFKAKPEEVVEKVEKLQEEKKQLDKQLAEAKKQAALGGGGSGDIAPENVNGMSFIGKSFADLPPKELRDLATTLAQQHEETIIAVASSNEGKASIIVAAGKHVTNIDCPALVRIASEAVGGQGGGGKSHFAQAGGPNGKAIDQAIDAIRASLSEQKAA